MTYDVHYCKLTIREENNKYFSCDIWSYFYKPFLLRKINLNIHNYQILLMKSTVYHHFLIQKSFTTYFYVHNEETEIILKKIQNKDNKGTSPFSFFIFSTKLSLIWIDLKCTLGTSLWPRQQTKHNKQRALKWSMSMHFKIRMVHLIEIIETFKYDHNFCRSIDIKYKSSETLAIISSSFSENAFP